MSLGKRGFLRGWIGLGGSLLNKRECLFWNFVDLKNVGERKRCTRNGREVE